MIRKPLLTPQELAFYLIAFLALTVVSVLLVLGNLKFYQSVDSDGDFYSMWNASRAALFDGVDPYGSNIASETQQMVYGRPAGRNENPYLLDIPFPILILFFPFAFISDFKLTQAIYALFCELLFCGIIYFQFRLMKIRLTPLLYLLVTLALLLNFYTFQTFQHLSSAIPLAFSMFLMMIALESDLEELTGALIAVSLFRFEITGLFLVLAILYVIDQKQWRVAAGFLMTAIVLISISYFLYPLWFQPYWVNLLSSLQLEYGFVSHNTLQSLWPGISARLVWFPGILLILLLLYEWVLARTKSFQRFYWVVSLAFAISPFLGVRSDLNQWFVMLPGSFLFFAFLRERWAGTGTLVFVLLTLLLLALPWVLFLDPRFSRFDWPKWQYLFLPVINIFGLYWVRWWVVNPPRTYLDANLS